MHRLYALQRRLALTKPEASALVFISILLLAGFCVRYVQGQSVPFSAADYAELHTAFEAQTDTLRAEVASDATADSTVIEEGQPVQVAEATPPRRAVSSGPVRMNLNTASARTLQRLPGIGPAISARIVEYREAYGGFRHPREIVRVKGIGPKTYEKIAPYLFVDEIVDASDGE
jgi:competence protein ComEA